VPIREKLFTDIIRVCIWYEKFGYWYLLVSIPCRKVQFPCDQKLVSKVPIHWSEIQNQSKYYNQNIQVRCR